MIEELRFGNKILRKKSSIDGWVETTVNLTYMGLILEFPEDYKPIPLTEEWLLKFGFEKIEPVNAKLHPYPDYVKDGVIISLPYFEFTYNDGDNSRVLKYVHELMNLYYILTGEELEVKP